MGTVPVMTKGSFATYYGGADVVKQIEKENGGNAQPSLVFPAFFVVSSLFQIVLYLYKKVRSSQKRSIPSYLQALRRNLGKILNLNGDNDNTLHCSPVENVLNLYGALVLLVISGLMCYTVLQHYKDIKEGVYHRSQLSVPTEFLYFLLFIAVSTGLPFAKSYGLRFENICRYYF